MAGWRSPDSRWKYVGGGQRLRAYFDHPPKMSHSFIQNCCWITLQVSRREGWKTFCQKWNVKTIFFEAPETVWWLDPPDSDHPYFTTDLSHYRWRFSGPINLLTDPLYLLRYFPVTLASKLSVEPLVLLFDTRSERPRLLSATKL